MTRETHLVGTVVDWVPHVVVGDGDRFVEKHAIDVDGRPQELAHEAGDGREGGRRAAQPQHAQLQAVLARVAEGVRYAVEPVAAAGVRYRLDVGGEDGGAVQPRLHHGVVGQAREERRHAEGEGCVHVQRGCPPGGAVDDGDVGDASERGAEREGVQLMHCFGALFVMSVVDYCDALMLGRQPRQW